MPGPLPSDFYGVYAAEHHNIDYFADVGEKAVFVHKKKPGSTEDEWVTWVTIGDGDKSTNGDWEIPVKSWCGQQCKGGALADGQKSIEFKSTGFWGSLFGKVSFTIEIKEPVNPKNTAPITTYSLTFKLFKSEATNPVYASPPSTNKKTGFPTPYAEDTFVTGVARKLVGEFDATTASSDTTTTNDTSLLLGVGLMVVVVGFYGMSGKR